MNSIERERFDRNWLYLLLCVVAFFLVCYFDTPKEAPYLTLDQQREIVGRQYESVHSLEVAAMVKNQAGRW